MNAELNQLETRLAALLEAHQSLRSENHELISRVANLQVENRRLTEKVTAVTGRVERILAQLPVEDEA
jgi:regulator of replication initiation timing